MFETAELNRKISKAEFEAAVPQLRADLLEVQEQLRRAAKFPVVILLAGVDKGGKSETMNILNEWFDPRFLENNAFGLPTDEERERPYFWRFWRKLPAKGKIGLFCGSAWYSEPLLNHVYGVTSDHDLDSELIRIRRFETELEKDGALIIKFWFHLNKAAQKQRLKELSQDKATAWRVTKKDKQHLKLYDNFRLTSEHAIRETSTGDAPWVIIEGLDHHYRSITCAQTILEKLRKKLHEVTSQTSTEALPVATHSVNQATILNSLNMTQSLEKKAYRTQLESYQGQLNLLYREAYRLQISTVMVLEGWDAAGKGSLIRRVIPAIDARHYKVIPIAAPTEHERQFHYLWRFWQHLPRAGHLCIFDRSWYGRVLVERVEKFAKEDEWMRSYAEILDFEEQMTAAGIVLVKFWLHIDKDEQLARFQAREKIAYKQYKITEEDYRNREKWDEYEQAVNEMIERTSTEFGKWHLIEGNDKKFARIKALKVVCEAMEKALSR